jgi:hypothetical protein
MKTKVVCCLGLALFLFASASPARAEDMDVVVMVDVTWSLSEHFNDIERYLLGTLLTDVLHDGDTFHLLWFSDHPETLITGRVTDRKSREDFRTRLQELRNLQWTYGHYTDLVSAVAYLIQFTDKLPKEHKKMIILVTDGIHDPAPGTKGNPGQEELKRIFLSQAQEIKEHGWSIHILKTLLEKAGGPDQSTPFLDVFHDATNTTIVPFPTGRTEDLLSAAHRLPRPPGHGGTEDAHLLCREESDGFTAVAHPHRLPGGRPQSPRRARLCRRRKRRLGGAQCADRVKRHNDRRRAGPPGDA